MPRVTFVKKAQKDYPAHDIKKGESYYWWQFRFRPKVMSKTPPRRSQLTQSGFLQSLFDLQDRIANLSVETIEDLEMELDSIKEEVEAMREQCQESLGNMPEQLQESSAAGEMLQERIEAMESWTSDLDAIDVSFEEDETQTEEEKTEALKEFIDNAISEIQDTDCGL